MIQEARHQQGGSGGFEWPNQGKAQAIPFLSGRNARECLLGGIGVFALCMFGQVFYKVAGTLAAPLWPSSGLALALLLLCGWRLFPAITFGTIAATVSFGDNPIFVIAGSLGNTLESLIGWYLMTRLFDFSNQMQRVRDMMLLFLLGAPVGPLLNSMICTAGLVIPGLIKPEGIPLSLLCFWTGNVMGIIVFTPLFLTLLQRLPFVRRGGDLRRITIWLTLLGVIVTLGFWNHASAHTGLIPIAYLSFPILVWLALSMRHGVTLAITLVTTMVTGFTTLGFGPLIRYDPMATYGELSIFIALLSITCLIIMAVEEERVHGSIKKRLSTLTAGLGYWEWTQQAGVRNLALIDEESAAASAKMGFPRVLPNDWISRVDSGEAIHLPWNQARGGLVAGDFLSGDVKIGVGASVLTVVLTGRVLQVDREGYPVSILGTAREVTSERLSEKLRIVAAHRETELRNLRSTLNPHFLFNSLNVLKSLIVEDTTKAQRAVIALADLLRSALRATRRNLIPLRDELSIIRSFLDLQRMRFEGRLHAAMSIESEAESAMVPPMLFQQLVENAVKHGIGCGVLGGEIRVEALLDKSHLILITINPGTYTEGPHDGQGLHNIREPLDSIFGSDASFHIGNTAEGVVRAEVRIPLNTNRSIDRV